MCMILFESVCVCVCVCVCVHARTQASAQTMPLELCIKRRRNVWTLYKTFSVLDNFMLVASLKLHRQPIS